MCVQPPVRAQHSLLLLFQRSALHSVAHEHLLVLGEDRLASYSNTKKTQQSTQPDLFPPLFCAVHCRVCSEGTEVEGGERR